MSGECSWKLGDTFFCDDTIGYDTRHRIVVIANPYRRESDNELVVVAAISSFDGQTNQQDDTCVLRAQVGPPRIWHNSYIDYPHLREFTVAELDNGVKNRHIKRRESFSVEIQKQLLQGLFKTPRVIPRWNTLALDQLTELGWEIPN